MPLRLEPQRRRVYEQNPLKLVICQVRFPVITRFEEPGLVAPFEETLAEMFPRVAQEQQMLLTFGPSAPASPPIANQAWRFRTLQGATTVLLSRDAVTLETNEYRRFEEFSDLASMTLAATAALGVKVRERIGLRYVNEITHPDADTPSAWRQFLNPEMLGIVGGDLLGDDIVHALQNIRLREPDATVIVNHGFVSAEASGSSPAYQLDIDFGDETPTPFDALQTMNQVSSFHERIKNLFEMSLSDAMRDYLVVVDELDS